nr:ribonuclease P protein component [Hydrogenophaga sp. PBL-H3]
MPTSLCPARLQPDDGVRAVTQRLRSRQQFQAVMAGAPVAKTPHFALHRAVLDVHVEGKPLFPVADAWLGVLLPKRWARRAVTRNAIRRQIYEVARHQPVSLPQAAWVVRLRSEFSRKQFVSATSDALKRAVRAELEQLLSRAMLPKVAAPLEARDVV